MAQTHFYQVGLQYDTDRKGTVSSDVLSQKIEIATPPEFPKGMPNIWSPEHFFVAAINSCLMTTFLAVAENFKLNFVDFKSDAVGKLELVDKTYMISEVVLKPTITISNEADKALAEKVIEKAEKACLISNSVKSAISMEIKIIVL